MLITRPDHDDTTRYLYHWSKKIIDRAVKLKRKVTDLKGKKANSKEFTRIIEKKKPLFIVINGHGNEKAFTGFNSEVLVQHNVNEKILSNKVVFARSCRSAKILGPSCIRKGTKAYIGYREDFVFFIDIRKMKKPLDDETAKIFLEPSNQIAILLLDGEKAGEVHRKSKELYNRSIKKLLTSRIPEEDRELIPYLHWNMENQVCLGDGNSTVCLMKR